MAESLFLIAARAQTNYVCPACEKPISKGTMHYRHDPFPQARIHRDKKTTHWCAPCIEAVPSSLDPITRRRRIRVNSVMPVRIVEPVRVEVIQISPLLIEQLLSDPDVIHSITPNQFEEFICDRLCAMGLEPRRMGGINRKDGGIDVVFWPRSPYPFPFFGAAQVKHHWNSTTKEGPSSVREFAGAIAGYPFSAALLVTNTSFTPDAEWFARERARLIRLRGFDDIKRWIAGHFEHSDEWREIPRTIEICPGVTIRVDKP